MAALQRGVCDEAAARALYALGPDAVTLALLTAACRIAEALRTCLQTSRLPPPPAPIVANG